MRRDTRETNTQVQLAKKVKLHKNKKQYAWKNLDFAKEKSTDSDVLVLDMTS